MTYNALFFIVIACIIVFIWKGYNRGLIGIIFGIVAWIFAIYFIGEATPVIEQNLLNSPEVVQTIGEHVEKSLNKKVEKSEEKAEEEISREVGGEETDEFVKKLQELIKSEDKLQELTHQTEEMIEEKKAEVISEAAVVITGYIIHALATVLSIVIVLLIISLAWTIIQFLNHAPVIGNVSRFLGMLFGICEGFLVVYVFFYIISLIPGTALGQLVGSQIEENEFLLYLYNNNILRSFFA